MREGRGGCRRAVHLVTFKFFFPFLYFESCFSFSCFLFTSFVSCFILFSCFCFQVLVFSYRFTGVIIIITNFICNFYSFK